MGKFFDELMESVQEMDDIAPREREPSREFPINALPYKELGQPKCNIMGPDTSINFGLRGDT